MGGVLGVYWWGCTGGTWRVVLGGGVNFGVYWGYAWEVHWDVY